ncbi:hypothetical protein QFC22_001139 [Naganishia vaughanmartiniae]|uniref:Uncharacterized protein n=1 Tax=Naganishia vaughanmartiniae TaxID=1424756 RepID=A0ACC2XLM1_9TREE|nr:hypothetical protein QFC22_001139 [Naganishia vaughanmartiniae]
MRLTLITLTIAMVLGLRQTYRWNYLGACAYVTSGAGICNSTSFGHAFVPLATILSDTPAKFTNQYVLRAVGACAALVAFVAGVIPNRITFLVAALATIISAVGLCIGAAIWTVLIDKNDFLNIVKVQGGKSLGIRVSAGPALYLTWVAFACSAVSVAPYVISAFTYSKY